MEGLSHSVHQKFVRDKEKGRDNLRYALSRAVRNAPKECSPRCCVCDTCRWSVVLQQYVRTQPKITEYFDCVPRPVLRSGK